MHFMNLMNLENTKKYFQVSLFCYGIICFPPFPLSWCRLNTHSLMMLPVLFFFIPVTILVLSSSHNLIIKDNYHTWSRFMTMAPRPKKNKLGFVDRSILKPADSTDPLFSPWLHYNNMVISQILNFVSPYISGSVLYVITTYEIQTNLKE